MALPYAVNVNNPVRHRVCGLQGWKVGYAWVALCESVTLVWFNPRRLKAPKNDCCSCWLWWWWWWWCCVRHRVQGDAVWRRHESADVVLSRQSASVDPLGDVRSSRLEHDLSSRIGDTDQRLRQSASSRRRTNSLQRLVYTISPSAVTTTCIANSGTAGEPRV